jgi:hypothetical protein
MQKADCTFGRKAGSCCSSRQIKKNVDRPLCFATTMTYMPSIFHGISEYLPRFRDRWDPAKSDSTEGETT